MAWPVFPGRTSARMIGASGPAELDRNPDNTMVMLAAMQGARHTCETRAAACPKLPRQKKHCALRGQCILPRGDDGQDRSRGTAGDAWLSKQALIGLDGWMDGSWMELEWRGGAALHPGGAKWGKL